MFYANKQENQFKYLETLQSSGNDGIGTSAQILNPVDGNIEQNENIEAIVQEIDENESHNKEQEQNLENIEDDDHNNEEEVIK